MNEAGQNLVMGYSREIAESCNGSTSDDSRLSCEVMAVPLGIAVDSWASCRLGLHARVRFSLRR